MWVRQPHTPLWTGVRREQAYVSTQQPSSRQDARLPVADAYPRRSVDLVLAPAQGSRRTLRLTPRRSLSTVLATPARLRLGSEIRAVARRGVRVSRSGITVQLLAARPGGSPLAATVIVGRAAGGAVARNRLRRQVRHSVRRSWAHFPPGAAVVVRAKPPATALSSDALDGVLRELLRAARQRSTKACS